jgi:heptosyltransferase-2
MGADRPRMNIPQGVTRGVRDPGLLAICPGAEYGPAKQWPAGKFADVAAGWLTGTMQTAAGATATERRVVLLGGPKDAGLGEQIRAWVAGRLDGDPGDRLRNLCGTTSLMEAFAILSGAGIALSNDSGLMHAAAALDVPVLAIFGSTDPRHTPPHSPRARIIHLGLSCSPCFARTCPLGTTACLNDIPSQHVLRALDEMLPR